MHIRMAVVLFLVFRIVHSIEIPTEVSFQRIQQNIGFNIFKTNLRITKFNRTCAVVNGTIDLFIDLDNSFTVTESFAPRRPF